MNKTVIQLNSGKVTDFKVLTTAHVVTDDRVLQDLPAILSISQHELMQDEPILSMTIKDMTFILEFNSDFPLLFKEGIKLYGSNN